MLEDRLSRALAAAGAPDGSPALVGPAAKPQFGDYQVNGVMAAAKKLKTNPRQLAEKVLAAADLSDLAEKTEIAGPGFINVTLKTDWLAQQVNELPDDARLGVPELAKPQAVVVDYSSPNLAKEMHVGHLRSTIIGDALARTLDFLGHNVKRQNHVGDWGTQFGMLIAYMDRIRQEGDTDDLAKELADLEELYRKAKHLFDTDLEFAAVSRGNVIRLQSGDEHCKIRWLNYTVVSLLHCYKVYKRLGALLTNNDTKPESEYKDDLPKVVKALKDKGLLTESKGARCVFLDEFMNADGGILPVIVQKSDGAYLYATTDLAAMRYRVGEFHADRILYVTDSRQGLHFRQVFAVARKAGFVPEGVSLEHVAFGMMLGAGGQPFKTREGGVVKLTDLLDQAEAKAFELVSRKNPHLPDEQKKDIAHKVGIGAVKYADLSQNRTSDYVFSWDKMLSLEGNTAPYMQYAYARIRSIFRKSGESTNYTNHTNYTNFTDSEDKNCERERAGGGGFVISHPAERSLAVKLLQFPETIETVAAECLPNVLCSYLYELAGAFTRFYENCPVLKSDEPLRSSRLRLCELTARVIKTALGLLGIETVEQM